MLICILDLHIIIDLRGESHFGQILASPVITTNTLASQPSKERKGKVQEY
jgi:hypothetical protein